MLLQKGEDARDARAHQVVTASGAFTEPGGGREKHRHRQQRYERQAYVHPSHHGDNRDNHHQITEQVSDARREQLVQRVHVGGQPRHDPSDWIAIEISDLLVLQLVIDFAAQIEHNVLADAVEEDRLKI